MNVYFRDYYILSLLYETMIVNFNIGLLGHVDSGKTSLAKVLSTISSTASFDKNPQSKERGITLDLGFSALQVDAPEKLKREYPTLEQLQFTFVDCPGHASLIRTIIGGAQIIDLMILVIDAQKGIQTQTAECILIGDILQHKLIVVINKVDLLLANQRIAQLKKLEAKLRKTLASTNFGEHFSVFAVSALTGEGIQELLGHLKTNAILPHREKGKPLLMYVDHCFSIKGQGTICTGTIVQGCVHVNDNIELPVIKVERKIKSIQMFRQPVQQANMGDRVGVCVTQFNAKLMERGIITQIGYLKPIYATLIQLHPIQYYKYSIKSKTKFHVSVGHETVMSQLILFKSSDVDRVFDPLKSYEYVEELGTKQDNKCVVWALLEFEKAIFAASDSMIIASKLDLDINANCCRLAFWGKIQWQTTSMDYANEELKFWKIFKNKQKQSTIQRFVNSQELIVQNLFKKESNRQLYIGKQIELSTGEIGRIESTFGQTSKVKITFPEPLNERTVALIKEGRLSDVCVILKFKKNYFNKDLGIIQ